MKTNSIYLEAPNYLKPGQIRNWDRTVFLAGSITGAQDWQKIATDKLLPYFHVFNPRRANYDCFVESEERNQITWEHNYLNLAEIILFHFSYETLAPVTLLEYGSCLESAKVQPFKKLYISIHPEYKRKNDVIIQTELRNNKFSRNIYFNLDETIEQIIKDNTCT